ncbi:hypothetical protein B0H19DRAFT_1140259 [Mycena capillaripes]|nr:hypothetical protein B0H19DRAFT_1140259 [Mycena capillaripes]
MSSSSSSKNVHWKLTVDQYAVENSPESWTTPLPSRGCNPFPAPSPAPSPTPGRSLELHPALTPTHALQLDLSFPSDAFRRNPQLIDALLAAHASNPPRRSIRVRICDGLYKVRFEIRHGSTGEAVTVGDVLTGIQRKLREYDNGTSPAEAQPYMLRRIDTVNGYCDRRDRRLEAANVDAERKGNGRFVDHLLGQTLFAGLEVHSDQAGQYWQLMLQTPPRYMLLYGRE